MTMSENFTATDASVSRWGIDDPVTRLRVWGTDDTFPLVVGDAANSLCIGTSGACTIRLADRQVSREHATLSLVHGRWFVTDRESKNGTWLDGTRMSGFVLMPGSELRMGATTLVAESERSIDLRMFLGRILGWSYGRRGVVDSALRALRCAAARRTELYMVGDTDLVPVVHALHRRTLGADRPFLTCDPRRGDVSESVRSVANKTTGLAALAAAAGGSVCVRSERLPVDFRALLLRLREPTSSVQLVVVGKDDRDAHDEDRMLNPAIEVPPLASRASEIPMIVDHYAEDAADELLVPRETFTQEDREWVLSHAAGELAEIEKATLRLVALRASRTLSAAAGRLHMAPISLTRWFGRRRPPPSLEPRFAGLAPAT